MSGNNDISLKCFLLEGDHRPLAYFRRRQNADRVASVLAASELIELSPPDRIACEDDIGGDLGSSSRLVWIRNLATGRRAMVSVRLAAAITQLGEDEIQWALEEHGECETESHAIAELDEGQIE